MSQENIKKAPLTFSYNGSPEYHFDISDADDSEKFEKANEQMQAAEKLQAKDGKLSSLTRSTCKLIKDFLAGCLGDEAVVAFFGDKDNLTHCYEAYAGFLNMVAAQRDQLRKTEFGIKATQGNRAQRRNHKKHGKKGGNK